jgi:outer membrane cobalamin receptor
MLKKLLGVFLFLSMSLGLAQAAQETKTADTIYTLGEVVVTASDEKGVESAATLHQITAKDMELRNVKTLDKALELLPGLQVRKGAQGIPRIDMRGLRSRHVLLLLDGIPFNSTYDGQFDPSTIPVENIAKIKVSYGGHSVLYGPGGLGGVINIITKKGSQKFHSNAAADIDERGNPDARADISGGNGQVDFFVSASKRKSDGYLVSDDFTPTSQEDGGVRENSDFDRESLFANTGFKAGDDFKFGVSVGVNQGEYGQPPSTLTDNTDPFYKKPKYERVEDYTNNFGQVSMGYDPGGVFGLRAWAFANKNEENRARYDDDNYNTITQKGAYTTEDETLIKGLALQTIFDYDTYGKIALSANGERDEYDSNGNSIKSNNGPLVPYTISEEIDLYSLAFEYDITLFEKLGLVAGYSHNWQKKEVGSDEDKGSYLLGLSYDLTQTTRLRASYARKIRFASIKNLYDSTSGDSDLTAEQSDNYEAGITQQLPWEMTGDLVFFLNDVKDYIEKNDTTEFYENHDEYLFKGVEATLSKAFLETGMIRVGYSFLDATDESTGSSVDELQYRPKHKITLEGSYSFDFGLTAQASFMRLMDQYYYNDDYTAKGKLEDFSIVDIRLEQNLLKNMWFVYAGVDNLLDENYEESYGFPQAGRTAYIGMRVKF